MIKKSVVYAVVISSVFFGTFCLGADSALFPTDQPSKQWIQFKADGFSSPVSGVVYRKDDPVVCGMPLGGIDTGCIDLETSGLLGYSTIFGSLTPRMGQINLPILGMRIKDKTWVFCKKQPKTMETAPWITPGNQWGFPAEPLEPSKQALELSGVELPQEIYYWGHYPIADIEYQINAPVRVAVRAWSPFIPGDVTNSMIPGAVFEVRLLNITNEKQKGTLAFTFPGPTKGEAGCSTFKRQNLTNGMKGIHVAGKLASYTIAVMCEGNVRTGGQLSDHGESWLKIDKELSVVDETDGGASVAVDYVLKGKEEKVIQFILAWSAPYWWGSGEPGGRKNEQTVTDVWICPKGRWDPESLQVAELTYQKHNRRSPAMFDQILEVEKGQKIALFLGAKKGHPVDFTATSMKVELLEIGDANTGSYKVGHTWDLKEDWSYKCNPNGQWEYGTMEWIDGKPLPYLADWLPNNPNRVLPRQQPAWAKGVPETGSGAWAKLVVDGPFGNDSKEGDIVAFPWASVLWISPIQGKVRVTGSAWMIRGDATDSTDPRYTHMYAKYYPDATSTANYLLKNHGKLLRRIIAWQEVVYSDKSMPIWLRDALINNLHLLTECSVWAQKTEVMPNWVTDEDGLFALNESPRSCPQMECLPCSFYGSLPLVYFFPELQLSTIRAYKNYQRSDGCPAWVFGPRMTLTQPNYNEYQASTNGISLAAIVDRFLQVRGNKDYLSEFYPMLKAAMEYSIFTRVDSNPEYTKGEQIISMPTKYGNKQWFEADNPGWKGCVGHVGLLTLAQAQITERLARTVGDIEYAEYLNDLVKLGAEAMERRLWVEEPGYYLHWTCPVRNETSDLVFGYQLDGEWINAFHGLKNVVPNSRIKVVLDTIKELNIGDRATAVNYINPNGLAYQTKEGWDYGSFSYFPPEALMLAMTYMYHGRPEIGEKVAQNTWRNITCIQGYTWDMPNVIQNNQNGIAGTRWFGTDYYQDMMLWALPAAMQRKEVGWPVQSGNLVDQMIKAGRK